MTSIFMHKFDQSISVSDAGPDAESWQAIQIHVGNDTVAVSREEATQLAADLLNVARVTPADAKVQA